jgi:hypothetical protein
MEGHLGYSGRCWRNHRLFAFGNPILEMVKTARRDGR